MNQNIDLTEETHMVSSPAWVQSWTALSTTDSSIMLEVTAWRHSKVRNTKYAHLHRHHQIKLTWLLLHCVQNLFNNIIQFRGIHRLQNLHQIPAGFTETQTAETLIMTWNGIDIYIIYNNKYIFIGLFHLCLMFRYSWGILCYFDIILLKCFFSNSMYSFNIYLYTWKLALFLNLIYLWQYCMLINI